MFDWWAVLPRSHKGVRLGFCFFCLKFVPLNSRTINYIHGFAFVILGFVCLFVG